MLLYFKRSKRLPYAFKLTVYEKIKLRRMALEMLVLTRRHFNSSNNSTLSMFFWSVWFLFSMVCSFTSVNLIISPLVKQSFLLSSNTVFMFSIQTASTGPSKRYHFLSDVELELPSRIIDERIPSVLDVERNGRECDYRSRLSTPGLRDGCCGLMV